MATSQQTGEIISVDSRPIRDIGNAIGQSLDIGALRELGVVDDNGELVADEIPGRQIIRDDGTIQIKIDIPDASD